MALTAADDYSVVVVDNVPLVVVLVVDDDPNGVAAAVRCHNVS